MSPLACDGRRATYLAAQPNDEQFTPSLDPTSTKVVYASRGTNLAPGDPTTGGEVDVFMSDYLSGGTTALSRTAAGFEPNGSSFNPSSSGNGTRVAFESNASNLVPGDTNGMTDVFVRAARRVHAAGEHLRVARGGGLRERSTVDQR